MTFAKTMGMEVMNMRLSFQLVRSPKRAPNPKMAKYSITIENL
jgi:hypothetical protein